MEMSGTDPDNNFSGGRGWLRLDSKGFLLLSWAEGLTVTSADARAALEAVQQLTDGTPLPILIRTNGNDLSPAAAALLRQTTLVSAVALVGATPVDRVIGAKMKRGRHQPHAFFTDEDRAAQWLLSPTVITGTEANMPSATSAGLLTGARTAPTFRDGDTEQFSSKHPSPLVAVAPAEEVKDSTPTPCRLPS
ncbi:hypothetical protein BWQ92_00180 [Arthrobacter sp. QXT-31]|nr:hypothetical protein BWQ92_00180 [Arthrobacter sp. QXT-31]